MDAKKTILLKNRQVRIRELCGACGGEKNVEHPAWKELKRRHQNWRTMSDGELLKWFDSHGWAGYEMKGPPNLIDCPACGGKGYIEGWMSFEQYKKELES